MKDTKEVVTDLENLRAHAYSCHLTIPVEEIKLTEGLDLDLFSLEEVMTKRLYLRKMGRLFPVIETPYLVDTIRKLWEYLEKEVINDCYVTKIG